MLGFDYVIGSQLAALSEFQKFFGFQQADGTVIIPEVLQKYMGKEIIG